MPVARDVREEIAIESAYFFFTFFGVVHRSEIVYEELRKEINVCQEVFLTLINVRLAKE